MKGFYDRRWSITNSTFLFSFFKIRKKDDGIFIDKMGILSYDYNVFGNDEDEYVALSLKESRDGEKPVE